MMEHGNSEKIPAKQHFDFHFHNCCMCSTSFTCHIILIQNVSTRLRHITGYFFLWLTTIKPLSKNNQCVWLSLIYSQKGMGKNHPIWLLLTKWQYHKAWQISYSLLNSTNFKGWVVRGAAFSMRDILLMTCTPLFPRAARPTTTLVSFFRRQVGGGPKPLGLSPSESWKRCLIPLIHHTHMM